MFPSDLLLTWNRLINKLSNKSVHKGEGYKLLVSDRIDCIRSDWTKLVSSYVLAPNLSTIQMTFTRQIAQVGKIRLVQLLQIESLRRWQWPSGHGDQTSAGETRLCQQCPTPRRLWLISLFCSASSAADNALLFGPLWGFRQWNVGDKRIWAWSHWGLFSVVCQWQSSWSNSKVPLKR